MSWLEMALSFALMGFATATTILMMELRERGKALRDALRSRDEAVQARLTLEAVRKLSNETLAYILAENDDDDDADDEKEDEVEASDEADGDESEAQPSLPWWWPERYGRRVFPTRLKVSCDKCGEETFIWMWLGLDNAFGFAFFDDVNVALAWRNGLSQVGLQPNVAYGPDALTHKGHGEPVELKVTVESVEYDQSDNDES